MNRDFNQSTPRRWPYIGCAFLILRLTVWSMEESIWGAAPCAIVLIVLAIQFFRPSALAWWVLSIVFLTFGAVMSSLATRADYFIGVVFGFFPFLLLLWDKPTLPFTRSSATKVLLICTALTCTLFIADASHASESEQKSCKPKLVRHPKPVWPKLSPGSVVRRDPVIAYDIAESGAVENVHLVQSSGIPQIDQALITATKQWRYSPAPGCGIRKGSYTSLIHPKIQDSGKTAVEK